MLSSGLTLSTLNTATSVITDPLDVSSTSGEHQRGTQHHLPGISVISEWPHGSLVENVAAKHDGRLIVTVYSTNEIYEIDPYSTKFDRSLLATLPYGPTGIVELDFNHFYINVGSIGQRKTWSIYCLSLHHGIPSNVSIKKLVDIDSALYLNGLCVLSYEHGLLLSVDSRLGHIYKINIQTKQVELWYENDLFKSRTQDALIPGINGIRHCSIDNSIYLTNTDRALILRLAINPFDYRPKGPLETIVRNLVCDDFTIDHCRTIYATTHAHNSLIRLTLIQDGEYLREDIANINEGLAGATSCVFGRTYRDRTSLYITTTGGNIQSNQTDLLTQTKSVNVISNLSVISPTAKLLRLNIGVTTGLHEPPKRILVACSNHSRGIYLSEFSEPYNILRKKFGGKEGIEFIIASPKGGSIPIDPSSHPRTDLQRDQWSSAVRLLSLSSNPTLDHQYAQDYDAIYLPGGHAPLFDLVDNRSLKQLILDFDTQMKPIVAICHGVVGLVNTRRVNDGNSLIHGRILTGFSLEEELLSSENDQENLIEKSPFILEAKLRDQGAIYLKASPEKEHVVQDGLLLTGQNPASAKQLAYRFVQLLQQCSKHDYQQVNLTSSLPKTLITCHINLSANSNLLNRLKLAHLEYIQRHQHLIVLSGSTLFTDSTLNHTQQDASTMVILLATDNLKQAQEFIENEPYTASKEIFDSTSIKPFKQLFPNANNQLLLNYHIQQELFKSQRRHHHRHH